MVQAFEKLVNCSLLAVCEYSLTWPRVGSENSAKQKYELIETRCNIRFVFV